MFKSIIKNAEKAEQLHEQGYAVVPYLNTDEIKELTDFFYSAHPVLPGGMYASSHAADFELRKRMNEKIKAVCARALQITFQEVNALGSTFMTKSKGQSGTLHPHQDWNIVDERRFNSYNVWIPLVDVNEANGTISILPKSHTLLKNVRGLNIPSSFEKVNDAVWKYLKPLTMRAGEALVYDHRLLHASGENNTDTPRLVIVYGIIPNGAEMRYYYGNGDNIEVYDCSPDFFFNQHITAGPLGLNQLEVIKNENPQVSAEQLRANYEAAPAGLWSKISALWR
ncbi:MAG TPA: phytanoyl-CoA dioxygenase family protein [Chitinophagales bacterium]|nr:phytanoyl-CoA dioxygenase family protein [Chitinophagales bacterium]